MSPSCSGYFALRQAALWVTLRARLCAPVFSLLCQATLMTKAWKWQ